MLRVFFLLFVFSSGEWKFETQDFANLKVNKHYVLYTKLDNETNLDRIQTGIYLNISFTKYVPYTVFIKRRKTRLVNRATKFIIFLTNSSRIYPDYQNELLEGFVREAKYSSYVIGYLQHRYFYGKIQIEDKIYYLEPLKRYIDVFPQYSNVTENAIAFERSYVLSENENVTDNRRNVRADVTFNSQRRNVPRRIPKMGKVCSLLVALDYSFLHIIHQMNIDLAMQQVLLAIDEANSLFRSTDFDNDNLPDNVGFIIKYFTIFETPDNKYLIPYYKEQAMDGRIYIRMFSRFNLISEVCLAIIFTAQAFKNDIVGISYTAATLEGFQLPVGGICDRPTTNPYGLNLNTLAVSARNQNGKNVPQFIFDLSLCHELGHSFGSDHDVTKDCIGYIMAPHTPIDQNRKHFIFSSCSKKAMLKTMMLKGYCFDKDEAPYCGNNIKESTEQCDCGTVRDCIMFDACCIPHGRPNACQVKKEKGYTCHPSQGKCCTPQCHYANLKNFGVNCINFDKKCPCANNQTFCHCGINGHCQGSICNSEECTRVGLQECSCPATLPMTSCKTCCFSKTNSLLPCSPANEITKNVINIDFSILNKLKSYVNKQPISIKYGFFQKYCRGKDCVQLYFKNVSLGSFCTLFGELGDCSKHGCKAHNESLFYEKVAPNGRSTIEITSPMLILILYGLNYLCLINMF